MGRLSVAQTAERLGISKEAVYNRIRRGSLKTKEINGEKFVIFDDEDDQNLAKSNLKKTRSIHKDESEFIGYLIAQIDELKSQNLSLQADKDALHREKADMLIQSKKELENLHREKDERLMAFLNALKSPLIEQKSSEILDADIEDERKFIPLDEYLNSQNLDKKSSKKAAKKLIKLISKSKFLKFKNGVILVKKDKNLKQIMGEI